MTRNVQKSRADIPRACRGNIRAAFFTLPLVVLFSLALVPVSANIDNSGYICVHRCEAYANPAVVTGASAFIAECAAACGLSTSEYIATIVGVSATGSGMVIANDAGVSFGNSAADNLGNLVDAADYPDYDTLSAEQQAAWGTRGDYEAAKFNSLMSAFGLQDARDRYYSSGGQGFDFDEDESERLNQLGNIGSRWASGAANTFDDIRDAIFNRNSIYSYMGETAQVSTSNTGLNLPAGLYGSISGTTGNSCALRFSGNNWFGNSDKNVIWVYYSTGQSSYSIKAFSTEQFASSFNRGSYPDWDFSNNLASAYTVNDKTVYSNGVNFSYPGTYESSDISKIGDLSNNMDSGQTAAVGYLLLYGNYVVDTNLPEYPTEQIPDSTPLYYPEVITEDTPWEVYITQPETPPTPVERPETPYNPEDKTGKQEWREETTKNVLPLQNIRFDKLFPFCLMTDVKDLTEKIEETVTPGEQSDYLKIKIPMAYASDGEGEPVSEEMELDGTPLRDLLVMVRPFNQILLLFLMVFSLVMFWKSILTGD